MKALFFAVAYSKQASHSTSLELIRGCSHASRVGQLAWRPWSCSVYDLALGSVWWHLRVAACQPSRLRGGRASQDAELPAWVQQTELPCAASRTSAVKRHFLEQRLDVNPGLFWSQKARQMLDERPPASEKVHLRTASSWAAAAAALLLMHAAEDLCLCRFVGLGRQPVPNVKKARGRTGPLKQRLVAGLRVAGVCLQMLVAFSRTDVPTALAIAHFYVAVPGGSLHQHDQTRDPENGRVV